MRAASIQVRCDEKGFVAVCAFGMPGKTHDDGPSRGVLAALSIGHGMKVQRLPYLSRPLSVARFCLSKLQFLSGC